LRSCPLAGIEYCFSLPGGLPPPRSPGVWGAGAPQGAKINIFSSLPKAWYVCGSPQVHSVTEHTQTQATEHASRDAKLINGHRMRLVTWGGGGCAARVVLLVTTPCYAILFPGRRSVILAGFRPDSSRESLNIGLPVRPILTFSRLESGRDLPRKPDFRPGSVSA
jgi:hypothetical protein